MCASSIVSTTNTYHWCAHINLTTFHVWFVYYCAPLCQIKNLRTLVCMYVHNCTYAIYYCYVVSVALFLHNRCYHRLIHCFLASSYFEGLLISMVIFGGINDHSTLPLSVHYPISSLITMNWSLRYDLKFSLRETCHKLVAISPFFVYML